MASRLANVNHLLSEEAAATIKKYPDEEASVILIQHYFNHPDDTRRMDELLAVLSPKLNDFYLVRKLQEYSTRAKRTALGAEAPGFNVKNIYGAPVSWILFRIDICCLRLRLPGAICVRRKICIWMKWQRNIRKRRWICC